MQGRLGTRENELFIEVFIHGVSCVVILTNRETAHGWAYVLSRNPMYNQAGCLPIWFEPIATVADTTLGWIGCHRTPLMLTDNREDWGAAAWTTKCDVVSEWIRENIRTRLVDDTEVRNSSHDSSTPEASLCRSKTIRLPADSPA